MISLKFIRENPDAMREGVRQRHITAPIDEILRLDEERRQLLSETESLKAERNRLSKEVGRWLRQDPAQAEALKQESSQLGQRIDQLDAQVRAVDERLNALLLEVPNLPHASVPLGQDERQNVVLYTVGEPRQFDFEPLPHWELGERLGIIDFERGVKLSGTRFYVLKGLGARLQRALIAWMLDLHIKEHGYTEIYPPYVVKRECMVGAGQLPKFEDNIYHDVEDDLWLIGTAEIPLTNLHRDEILPPGALPLHYVAYSACFRREKMAAGKDTRGIKRGHQFDKVEMYKFATPETSYEELERLLDNSVDVCRRLGIAHRVLALCTGDLGFASAKTYDVETWAPGCGEWLEVASCSNCESFQAIRSNVRFRREAGARPEFVHTLNGSGLALPRTLIAVIENYQQADGSIAVPAALRPYMAGVDVIR